MTSEVINQTEKNGPRVGYTNCIWGRIYGPYIVVLRQIRIAKCLFLTELFHMGNVNPAIFSLIDKDRHLVCEFHLVLENLLHSGSTQYGVMTSQMKALLAGESV